MRARRLLKHLTVNVARSTECRASVQGRATLEMKVSFKTPREDGVDVRLHLYPFRTSSCCRYIPLAARTVLTGSHGAHAEPTPCVKAILIPLGDLIRLL